MRARASDAYATETRRSERRVRTGPFVTTVQGGWVGRTQSQTSKVASYRSTPVRTFEHVEHYRDSYAVHGADPSLPDALRSLETTRIHTGRDTWMEECESTSYEREFDGYRDVAVLWRDISWDGGGTTRSRWIAPFPGDRVYHVGISLFGRMLHSRLYDAARLQWERPAGFGWRLLGRQALELVAVDIAAWRSRARHLQPGGISMRMGDLVCFDGTVTATGNGTAMVDDGGGIRSIPAKSGVPMREGDFLLLAGPAQGRSISVIHNVTTGATWRICAGSARPSAGEFLRRHALTAAAGLIGIAALALGLRDNAVQHLTAPVVLAAIGAGYLLGRRASDRLAADQRVLERARRGIDDVDAYFRTLGWKGIRSLPPARQAPAGKGRRR